MATKDSKFGIIRCVLVSTSWSRDAVQSVMVNLGGLLEQALQDDLGSNENT
jgi:hypothetical protein